MRYGFILTVVAGDAKQPLRDLGTGIEGKLIERDADAGLYVLGMGGVPITVETVPGSGKFREIEAHAIIGYNEGLSQNVLIELGKLQARSGFARTQIAFSPALTRAEMEARMRTEAGLAGCEAVWVLKAGDSTVTVDNAALLAKFEALT